MPTARSPSEPVDAPPELDMVKSSLDESEVPKRSQMRKTLIKLLMRLSRLILQIRFFSPSAFLNVLVR